MNAVIITFKAPHCRPGWTDLVGGLSGALNGLVGGPGGGGLQAKLSFSLGSEAPPSTYLGAKLTY